jgi:hypothetical protein
MFFVYVLHVNLLAKEMRLYVNEKGELFTRMVRLPTQQPVLLVLRIQTTP